MAIELDTSTARLLTEIGFLGIGRGLHEAAEVVFTALARLRPADEAGPVGLALAAMAQGAPGRAAEVLRRAPQTEAVIAFRAMALTRLGETRLARELREELAASGASDELLAIAGGGGGES